MPTINIYNLDCIRCPSQNRINKQKTPQEIKTMRIARKGTKLPLLTNDITIHAENDKN